ncbi:hypothetical protein SAMN05216244_1907 [Sediminibacillus halophilus]|uniref:Uncharacterized protein n=1 Tax=Sediminibacillus halophilus TaxID=482461 RepID=A0A1G9RAT8_9BACI|nr:hypothetical protein SAMN05216244_1907 [Sediminibacillus halophilus]
MLHQDGTEDTSLNRSVFHCHEREKVDKQSFEVTTQWN